MPYIAAHIMRATLISLAFILAGMPEPPLGSGKLTNSFLFIYLNAQVLQQIFNTVV